MAPTSPGHTRSWGQSSMRWRVSPRPPSLPLRRGTRGIRQSLVGDSHHERDRHRRCRRRPLPGRSPHRAAADVARLTLRSELAEEAVVVPPETDLETAARTAARRRPAQCGRRRRRRTVHGFVPPERLLQVLELEHEEDLARLGGFLRSASTARMASLEPVARRCGTGCRGWDSAFLAQWPPPSSSGHSRTRFVSRSPLALFLPAVVYMADAVGTRTETVVIRGIALGFPFVRSSHDCRGRHRRAPRGCVLRFRLRDLGGCRCGRGRRRVAGDQLLDRVARRDGVAVRAGPAGT